MKLTIPNTMNFVLLFISSTEHFRFAKILNKLPINKFESRTVIAMPVAPKFKTWGFGIIEIKARNRNKSRMLNSAANLKKPIPVITLP